MSQPNPPLDRVLPTRLRHEVRALSGSVESFGGGRTPVDPEVLMTLARACRDEIEAGGETAVGRYDDLTGAWHAGFTSRDHTDAKKRFRRRYAEHVDLILDWVSRFGTGRPRR
jgi:hypothetical protein